MYVIIVWVLFYYAAYTAYAAYAAYVACTPSVDGHLFVVLGISIIAS
jgi:hypothetical protein